MKKIFFASALMLGSLSLYSCGGETEEGVAEDGVVVERDTAVSELEVERTIMDVDTTVETQTETIEEPGVVGEEEVVE
ncbi:hypothetical protein CLV24_10433 [Pontibacter ummariensis]|uniref:Uncharacterized protein n=1 Tax=Pontibacter ummariensis TaxID=1610492 RepID=A0A239D466_9BACT|nr:hypothetical protein [Pontibacter ummariensis]PRY14223.1 hypothetical protein CLV24_10433 [Pontibacter ummariensis]SNS26828.1 hypothetical protein SAMN06296052_10433 [Pontibacter ummariensis]